MIENEITRLWKDASASELIRLDKTRLLFDLQSETQRLENGLLARDRREIMVALLMIPVMLTTAWLIPFTVSKIAMVLTAVWCLTVVYTLRNVKKKRVTENSLPIKEYLKKYRSYVAAERDLLKNVLYWYVLPPTILALLFLSGFPVDYLRLTFSVCVVVGIGIFVYVLNQRAVKAEFDPLLKKIDKEIQDLAGENF